MFLSILEPLGFVTDQMFKMSDEWLSEKLCKHLRYNIYLVVIDGSWTKEASDDIRMDFPNTNLRSKILLTTRNRDVALDANPSGTPHNLRFLTNHESWELENVIGFHLQLWWSRVYF